jgi:hypothetical protein
MSGELETPDDNSSQSHARSPQLVMAVVLIVFLGGLPYLSVETARIALKVCGGALWLSAALWMAAAGLMCFPLWMAFLMLRRKFATGRFLLNRSESAARRAQMLSKAGPGKPLWPQAGIWVAPVVFNMFFIALGALAIAGATSFGPSSPWPFGSLLVLATLFLFIPCE